ncbi:uncharacterized protein RJT20DRAFT_30772 [Scheffersomyces xylosifermentans]|uniref:uncharacterized protein n=1 Tax=Scheffersomyces xylosifermentans TaxID=1304137 RepID=UPI00315C872B
MPATTRSPTNTLILTKVSDKLLNDPQPLVNFIAHENNYLSELVSLPRFGRILIICDSSDVSTEIAHLLKSSPQWSTISISYSIKDNKFSIMKNPDLLVSNHRDGQLNSDIEVNWKSNNDDLVEYLELPSESGSRRFLISPPLSPHAEWDQWDREEEGPNQKTLFSPQELSHLLWERLGGFDSSIVRKYRDEQEEEDYEIAHENLEESPSIQGEIDLNDQPQILFQNIDNGVPAIVLDTIKNASLGQGRRVQTEKTRFLAKTTMPPPLEE